MTKTLTFIWSVFKKKILKRILGFLILVWIWTMLFSKNDVLAQSSGGSNTAAETTQVQKMSEINELFTYISRTIYALLWPVLFIAGIALDNRLVYWSFLHLDASLWTLWNIMKNFANFALWFMVLFAIVKNIFTAPFGKSWDKWWPVSIIKKTLIAGVLIQASWFLMAAVIDVSTILTYSIWWLPMTVMQNNPKQSDLPILWVNAVLSTKWDNNKMDLQYYNTYWDKKISWCEVKKIPTLTWDYIVWRKQIFVSSWVLFEEWYCTMWWWPYRYLENEDYKPFSTGNDSYKQGLINYFSSWSVVSFSGLLEECKIIPTSFSELSSGCLNKWYGILKKSDNFFLDASENNKIKYTIDNLLDRSKWFVWPFITIYSSLLDFSSLATDPTGGNGVVADFLDLIIKLFFAVILFVPLVALAVVLIVRVWILWLVIAASPILVLIKVFEEIIGKKTDGLMWHFEFSNIIKMIFAPVFVVFAISMSMIFLSALNPRDVSKSSWLGSDQMAELWMEKIEEKTYSILWLVEITLDIDKVDKWMDMFAWFITMFFATGIVWFFLFFAIRRMTKIWESVGKWLQESFQNLAKNLPIIPVGGWWVWIEAAKWALSAMGNKIPHKLKWDQEAMLREKYPWLYPGSTTAADRGEEWFAKLDKTIKSQIVSWIISGKTWDTLNDMERTALKQVWIENQEQLNSQFNSYITNNTEIMNNYHTSLKEVDGEKVSTLEAGMLTDESLEAQMNSSSWWRGWAADKVGNNIKTLDGIKVLTATWSLKNPTYKLVDVAQYNKEYLWITDSSSELSEEEMKKSIEKKVIEDMKIGDVSKLDEEQKEEYDKLLERKYSELSNRIDVLKEERNKTANPPANQTNSDWWWGDVDSPDTDKSE